MWSCPLARGINCSSHETYHRHSQVKAEEEEEARWITSQALFRRRLRSVGLQNASGIIRSASHREVVVDVAVEFDVGCLETKGTRNAGGEMDR